MNINIKPIETEYNGYRFRSRLEARWAVVFDAAGIRYVYEPEGFEMEDGTRYLPDFYLPDFGVYVEVKGSDEQLRKDFYKIDSFVDFGPCERGVLILGTIPHIEYANRMPVFQMAYHYKGTAAEDVIFETQGFRVTSIAEASDPEIQDVYEGLVDYGWAGSATTKVRYVDSTKWGVNLFFLKRCFDLARQARFEHGETPTAGRIRMMACDIEQLQKSIAELDWLGGEQG